MEDTSDGDANDLCLHRVFSPSLDAKKTWYALNSSLCCGRPSTFCSTESAKLFCDEYKQLHCDEVFGETGAPASLSWFSSDGRRTEKVQVSTTFGLVLGILRQKSLRKVPFLETDQFKALVVSINSSDLVSLAIVPKPESPPILPESPPIQPGPSTRVLKREKAIEEIREQDLTPQYKKRKIRETASELKSEIDNLCNSNGQTLSTVLGECCRTTGKDGIQARDIFMSVMDSMVEEKGTHVAFSKLISEEAWNKRLESMRVPDWNYLLLKLKARISDRGWQDLTNLTRLGRTGKKTDVAIIPLKNNIVALRKGIFDVTRSLIGLESLPPGVPGFEVDIRKVVVWAIREMRLHSSLPDEVTFNLKIDGRPFCGKDQVAIGMVPLDASHLSSQSAKSVYPLAIANCREKREDLRKLFANLNKRKDDLKKHGVFVDGKHYRVRFKVTLDYKGLLLIMARIEDEDFILGGQGLAVEFCIFCCALRACNCSDLGRNEVCLEHFLETKANIGGFKGLRDDLTCLLDEDLTSMCLCALHCEMRNTEQLLKSVGLLAHEIGSLNECNESLRKYGPENFKGDRITVKLRTGQQTAASRNNISIASFSGSTERQILSAIEEVVEASLPQQKLSCHFQDPEAAKLCVLNKISFCEARQKYYTEMIDGGIFIRDFGTSLQEINLEDADVAKEIVLHKEFWKGKQTEIETKFKELYKPAPVGKRKKKQPQLSDNKDLSAYAASLTKEFYSKVCAQWKEIALIMRDTEFKEDEDHLIDTFDVKCKEWGFLLLEIFGATLGTGDYGHLTVEHVPMLFRIHRSLHHLSNQGFEAAHKLQRQLYLKATSHDSSGQTASLDQILTHIYCEMFLNLRMSFREACRCIASGQPFYYRGCGWSPKYMAWMNNGKTWVQMISQLFDSLFGPDFCQYEYTKSKHCVLVPGQFPLFSYDHVQWEKDYPVPGSADDTGGSLGVRQETPAEQVTSKETKLVSFNQVSISSLARTDHLTQGKIVAEQCTEEKKNHVSYNQVKFSSLTRTDNLTRGQIAAVKLPKVAFISNKDVVLAPAVAAMTDPKAVAERPSEATLKYALDLLAASVVSETANRSVNVTDSDTDDEWTDKVTVRVGRLGTFTRKSLQIFQSMCKLCQDADSICKEQNWLAASTVPDVNHLRAFLLNARPNDEVLRKGQFIMDVSDFSTLACERYVNGFAIDAVCLKLLEKHNQTKIVYLPTFSQMWAKQGAEYFKHRVANFFSHCRAEDATCILTPFHFESAQHWGVICFDATTATIYFDDGLKILPPADILSVIKNMLNGFRVLSGNDRYQMDNWNNSRLGLPLPRIGMPMQPSSGEGSASCGVGVILTIKDVIECGRSPPNFSWCFTNMANLRKELMVLILQWRIEKCEAAHCRKA